MDSESEEVILEVDSYQSALVVILSGLLVELEAVTLEVSNSTVDEVSGNSDVAVLAQIRSLHELEIGSGEYGAIAFLSGHTEHGLHKSCSLLCLILVLAVYTDMSKLVINRAAGTVELLDEKMSLDVGALAKGYATERLADYLYENDMMHYALDVGGNLRVVGDKPSGSGWQTGVRNPSGSGYVYKFTLKDSSAVTSGGYGRYYTVDGKRYHHIIDKDTLMPAEHLASVTVIYPDSGLADALSTALFCMEYDSGADIIRSLDGARAVWVFNDGTVKTIGFDN